MGVELVNAITKNEKHSCDTFESLISNSERYPIKVLTWY